MTPKSHDRYGYWDEAGDHRNVLLGEKTLRLAARAYTLPGNEEGRETVLARTTAGSSDLPQR